MVVKVREYMMDLPLSVEWRGGAYIMVDYQWRGGAYIMVDYHNQIQSIYSEIHIFSLYYEIF